MSVGRVIVQMDRQDKALIKAALKPNEYRRAVRRGLNKTARAGRVTLSKSIRQTFFVKARAVKQAVRLNNATNAGLVAEILVLKPRHKGVPLSEFSANRRRVGRGIGVSVKIRRDKPRHVVDKRSKYSLYGHGAFKTRSGRVLERKGRQRFPVGTPVGPTVQEMAQEINALEKTEKVVRRKLGANVEREVAFELRKRRAA